MAVEWALCRVFGLVFSWVGVWDFYLAFEKVERLGFHGVEWLVSSSVDWWDKTLAVLSDSSKVAQMVDYTVGEMAFSVVEELGL